LIRESDHGEFFFERSRTLDRSDLIVAARFEVGRAAQRKKLEVKSLANNPAIPLGAASVTTIARDQVTSDTRGQDPQELAQ